MLGLCVWKCVVSLGMGVRVARNNISPDEVNSGATRKIEHSAAFISHFLNTCERSLPASGTRPDVPSDFPYKTQIKR